MITNRHPIIHTIPIETPSSSATSHASDILGKSAHKPLPNKYNPLSTVGNQGKKSKQKQTTPISTHVMFTSILT